MAHFAVLRNVPSCGRAVTFTSYVLLGMYVVIMHAMTDARHTNNTRRIGITITKSSFPHALLTLTTVVGHRGMERRIRHANASERGKERRSSRGTAGYRTQMLRAGRALPGISTSTLVHSLGMSCRLLGMMGTTPSNATREGRATCVHPKLTELAPFAK